MLRRSTMMDRVAARRCAAVCRRRPLRRDVTVLRRVAHVPHSRRRPARPESSCPGPARRPQSGERGQAKGEARGWGEARRRKRRRRGGGEGGEGVGEGAGEARRDGRGRQSRRGELGLGKKLGRRDRCMDGGGTEEGRRRGRGRERGSE